MRPLFSGDHYQLRLANADKQLQRQTLPPLRRTTWTPGSDGVNGHMVVDPRRRRSHILVRRLRRLLSKHDEYLHPDMVKQGKKHKKDITLIDLTDDNHPEGIVVTELESSEDEKECTLLAFLGDPRTFGDESGDEENFDKEGNPLVIKIELTEHSEVQTQPSPQTTTAGAPTQDAEPSGSPKGKGRGKGKSSRRQQNAGSTAKQEPVKPRKTPATKEDQDNQRGETASRPTQPQNPRTSFRMKPSQSRRTAASCQQVRVSQQKTADQQITFKTRHQGPRQEISSGAFRKPGSII
jgi:hypothetical protein